MRTLIILPVLAAASLCAQNAQVEGVVINRATGAGIAGVTVRLSDKDARHETATDDAGAFRITGLKPGEYRAYAEKAGFFASEAAAFAQPPVRVGVGNDVVRIRLEMIPPGSLHGRVLGVDGNPAAKVQVELSPGGGKIVTTSEDGSFAFDKLEPGAYRLMARYKTAPPASIEDGVRAEIVPTYFPSAVDPTLAEPITLRAGADQGGYEIRMQTAPVYRVRGVVVDAAGKPAAKAVVQIQARVAGGGGGDGFVDFSGGVRQTFSITSGFRSLLPPVEDPVVTKDDGVFEFPSVRQGDWVVRAEAGRYGATTISADRRDLDDVRLQLLETFDLTGSVEMSDGSPAVGDTFLVVALRDQDGVHGVAAVKEKDGTLRFQKVTPGRHRIIPEQESFGNYYAAAVLLGTADVTDQTVELTPVSPPIRVILKPGGMIRGTVEDGEGSTVVLLPQRLVADAIGRSVVCGAGGGFDFEGLPPGSYYAIALEQVDVRKISDALFLSGLLPRAASVRVEAGSTTSVQLRVNRSPP